jgi:hypothetical protein
VKTKEFGNIKIRPESFPSDKYLRFESVRDAPWVPVNAVLPATASRGIREYNI